VDEYNAGSSNVETFFAKLMAFTKKLNAEEKRGISEQLSEEELVMPVSRKECKFVTGCRGRA